MRRRFESSRGRCHNPLGGTVGAGTTIEIINPPTLHDPTGFGYSHVVRTDGLVLVAGQYGSGPDGCTTSGDFRAQATLAFENLGRALEAAGLGFGDVAMLRTYVVDHDEAKLAVLVGLIRERWEDRPPAQTLLGVASLALPDMLFEVDAVAVQQQR